MRGENDQSSFGNLWRRPVVRYPAASSTTHSAVLGGGWVGLPQDICASCHLPSLLIGLSYSACCRQQPRGIAQRDRQEREDGGRSEEGSQVGLTLWPPTAGAEPATRLASLRKGREGSVATNTRGRLRMCTLYLLKTNTLTAIKPLSRTSESGTYVEKHWHFGGCWCIFFFLPLTLSFCPFTIFLLTLLPVLLLPSMASLSGPRGGVDSVRQACMLGHGHLSLINVDYQVWAPRRRHQNLIWPAT